MSSPLKTLPGTSIFNAETKERQRARALSTRASQHGKEERHARNIPELGKHDENTRCTFSEEKIRDLPGFYRFRICTNCLLASLHAVNVCSRRASYLHIKLDAMVSGMTEPVALPRFY